MKLLTELKREYANDISNLTAELGLYILYLGFGFIIVGLLMTLYCWDFLFIFPIIVGFIIFSLTYIKALKLLIQAKRLELEDALDMKLEEIIYILRGMQRDIHKKQQLSNDRYNKSNNHRRKRNLKHERKTN